jgi:hypothetical protein
MRSRHSLAYLLLVLVALTAAGPLLLSVDCGDDNCPPACGDCFGCGLVADQPAPPVLVARLTSAALASSPRVAIPSSSPRQLDHVPLRRIA